MQPRPSTYSIVARDPVIDAVGVAVASKFVSIGSVVPYAAADAGAIATQSYANVAYGPKAMHLLRDGYDASTVVKRLTQEDDDAPDRQLGVVGQEGSVAAFTGADCLEHASHRQGENYTVQGNLMEGREAIDAMATAFETAEDGFPERLLAALQAGKAAGGDRRGERSAALYVAKPGGGYDSMNDRWIDVRVDEHDHPLDELERVFRIYDVTRVERESPASLAKLEGETARAVLETLANMGLYEGEPTDSVGERERQALVDFRGVTNFENHSLEVIEDALARGWDNADGTGKEKMVNAIWHGLSRLERH